MFPRLRPAAAAAAALSLLAGAPALRADGERDAGRNVRAELESAPLVPVLPILRGPDGDLWTTPQEPVVRDRPGKPEDRPWYERINVGGYTQVRYNRLPTLRNNDNLINRQGDRSIGEGNGFLVRRARVVLSGEVSDHLAIYLQPDFASVIGSQHNVVIVRDWYADVFLDPRREFRFRVGQSKVPYGFENMQSSRNRLPLDRNDALNSAVKDERDLGVFFYWSPPVMRERFAELTNSLLKGSGDYGMLALGVYNGQTANRPAEVDNLHVIGRLAVPLKLGSQLVEVGLGGYYGRYLVAVEDRGDMSYETPNGPLLGDARVFGTLVVYPQPIGFAAEYTYGVGPQQGREDPFVIDSERLHGGYVQAMANVGGPLGTFALIPYARYTYYDGGKKFFANAPHYLIRELEAGFEWQLSRTVELVGAYVVVDRTSDNFPHDQEYGHIARFQLQFRY